MKRRKKILNSIVVLQYSLFGCLIYFIAIKFRFSDFSWEMFLFSIVLIGSGSVWNRYMILQLKEELNQSNLQNLLNNIGYKIVGKQNDSLIAKPKNLFKRTSGFMNRIEINPDENLLLIPVSLHEKILEKNRKESENVVPNLNDALTQLISKL